MEASLCHNCRAKLIDSRSAAPLDDPQTAYGHEPQLFWLFFIDAAKMYFRLTNREPTAVHMPPAMLEMFRRYHREVNGRDYGEFPNLLGFTVHVSDSDFWFD